ncbi:MAG: hypothetical protein IJQ70_09285 [Synergistaceae bacterium]|nr:hypothetical protein [Synergistaceae bacterium]
MKVYSRAFGEGNVVNIVVKYITIQFSTGEKQFMFPSAFDGFLTTADEKLQNMIAEAKEKELAEKKQRELNPAQEVHPVQERKAVINSPKTVRENIAFKCNYCDGGKNNNCVGFKGVCSDTMIKYNIGKAKHVWCASDSPCKKYYDGEISKKDLDRGFLCYESKMLVEWKASAGVVQNGVNKGKPMRLDKVQNNSLCVLTTRLPNGPEESRFIFAAFLVDESYDGDGREEGYVTNNSKWRIELRPDEAKRMLFWNYYVNKNAPERIVFGSGLHRYLSDMQAAQILNDIIKVKSDPEEKAFAAEFFEHFCKISNIDPQIIAESHRTLKIR